MIHFTLAGLNIFQLGAKVNLPPQQPVTISSIQLSESNPLGEEGNG